MMLHGYQLYARGAEVVAVKHGFSWGAALVPILWALYYRMWWEALVLVGLALVWSHGGADTVSLGTLVWFFCVAVGWFLVAGFWGNWWRMVYYRAHRFRDCGWVVASSPREACGYYGRDKA